MIKDNIFAYTSVGDAYYPAFVSINRYTITDEVSITVRSEHETSPIEVEVVIPNDKLIEMARSILGQEKTDIAMPHFIALMEALEIPHPGWWLTRPPEMLGLVGKALAKQAKEVYDAEQKNEQKQEE